MPPQLALIGCWAFVLFWLVRDARRRGKVSFGAWNVALWVALIGSRPVSTWFDFGGGGAEAYDEGNPFERMVYFVLIFNGLVILFRRGVKLGLAVQANRWLFVFFLYWACSVLWADIPIVALKRWIKDLGNVVMVLVILTEADPIDAAKAVFFRAAAVLVPMSFVFIKFFPSLGRTYHVWSGEMMYTGVTTHKNSLGVLAMVCTLFLFLDLSERMKNGRRDWGGILVDLPLLGLAAMLVQQAHSATALACASVGFTLLLLVRFEAFRRNVRRIEALLAVGALLLWATDGVTMIMRFVIVDLLGRDLTLTTRTDVWPMLLERAANPVVGAGFNSFWSGERLAEIYTELGIIQAHNGYLETYLNGGVVALALLAIVLLSAGRRINADLVANRPGAGMRLAFLAISIVYNCTEASFNKIELLWFACLVAIVRYPAAAPAPAPALRRTPANRRYSPSGSASAAAPAPHRPRRGAASR